MLTLTLTLTLTFVNVNVAYLKVNPYLIKVNASVS